MKYSPTSLHPKIFRYSSKLITTILYQLNFQHFMSPSLFRLYKKLNWWSNSFTDSSTGFYPVIFKFSQYDNGKGVNQFICTPSNYCLNHIINCIFWLSYFLWSLLTLFLFHLFLCFFLIQVIGLHCFANCIRKQLLCIMARITISFSTIILYDRVNTSKTKQISKKIPWNHHQQKQNKSILIPNIRDSDLS